MVLFLKPYCPTPWSSIQKRKKSPTRSSPLIWYHLNDIFFPGKMGVYLSYYGNELLVLFCPMEIPTFPTLHLSVFSRNPQFPNSLEKQRFLFCKGPGNLSSLTSPTLGSPQHRRPPWQPFFHSSDGCSTDN